jgi:hypothetical protein
MSIIYMDLKALRVLVLLIHIGKRLASKERVLSH